MQQPDQKAGLLFVLFTMRGVGLGWYIYGMTTKINDEVAHANF